MNRPFISDMLLDELFGDDVIRERHIIVIRGPGLANRDVAVQPDESATPTSRKRDIGGMKPWDLARRAAYERADAERAAIALATGEA